MFLFLNMSLTIINVINVNLENFFFLCIFFMHFQQYRILK